GGTTRRSAEAAAIPGVPTCWQTSTLLSRKLGLVPTRSSPDMPTITSALPGRSRWADDGWKCRTSWWEPVDMVQFNLLSRTSSANLFAPRCEEYRRTEWRTTHCGSISTDLAI